MVTKIFLFILLVLTSCINAQNNSVNAKIEALYDSIAVHRQEIDYLKFNRPTSSGSLINVLDYGARNTGLESDSLINFNAIRDAWNAAAGRTLYFPTGTYVTTEIGSAVDGFIYDNSLMCITGDGPRRSIIKLANSSKNYLVNMIGTKWHNFTITNIGFYGNKQNRKELVKIGGYNYSLQNVYIKESGNVGLSILGVQISLINVESELNDSINLLIYGSRSVTLLACSFEQSKIGLYITAARNDGTFVYNNLVRVISPYFETTTYSLVLDKVSAVYIENPCFSSSDTVLVKNNACYNELSMVFNKCVLILDSTANNNNVIDPMQFYDGKQWYFDYGTNNKVIER